MTTITEPPRRSQLAPATAPDAPLEAELRFTETYRRHRHDHPAIREAMCLRAQLPAILQPIAPGDLLAGRVQPVLVGFSVDEWGSCAFGYYHLPAAIAQALADERLDPVMRERGREMLAFWDQESTAAKVRCAYPPDMARWLPSDNWMGEPGVAFPLYRLTGGTVDYATLLRLGIPGLAADIARRRERAADEGRDAGIFDGMLIALGRWPTPAGATRQRRASWPRRRSPLSGGGSWRPWPTRLPTWHTPRRARSTRPCSSSGSTPWRATCATTGGWTCTWASSWRATCRAARWTRRARYTSSGRSGS
jgi:hypothetical protein